MTAASLMIDARARLAAGDVAGAARLVEEAAVEWRRAGNTAEEARCHRLAATLARYADQLSLVDGVPLAGYADLAERLVADAEAGGDHAIASSLALLAAGRALDRRDLDAARAHAERARAEALAGRSVAGYVSAAVALAGLADAAGDRVGAYASLAVGWATLRDLVGADGARAAFRPPLLALRQQWGTAAFEDAKAGYETKVRHG
jgi:hypothetical protein